MPKPGRTFAHKKLNPIVSKLSSRAYDEMQKRNYEKAADIYQEELLPLLGKKTEKWNGYKFQLCVCYHRMKEPELAIQHC